MERMYLLDDCYGKASVPEDLPNVSGETNECGSLPLAIFHCNRRQKSAGWQHLLGHQRMHYLERAVDGSFVWSMEALKALRALCLVK